MNLRDPSAITAGFVDAVQAAPMPRPAVGWKLVGRPATYRRAAWRDERDAQILAAWDAGSSQKEIAQAKNVSPSLVSYIIRMRVRG